MDHHSQNVNKEYSACLVELQLPRVREPGDGTVPDIPIYQVKKIPNIPQFLFDVLLCNMIFWIELDL